ncbi:hypothetical protein [Phyllobacterium salinisoli]|nr:hypothetical protein [Phyllobacterium salinisoli]
MLREETYLAEHDMCPWQDSIVGIIDAIVDAGAPVANDREFLWRYVTSITLPLAQQLLARIDEGSISTKKIDAVSTDKFDLVVAATGFSPPPLYHRGRTLYFGGCFSHDMEVTQLSSDLRVVLSVTHGPERIWAIGPASGIRIPFANFLHTASRQASWVAGQIADKYAPDQAPRQRRQELRRG